MPFRDSPARRSSKEHIRLALAKVRSSRIQRRRRPGGAPDDEPAPCPPDPHPGGLSGGAAALIESD